MELIKSYSEDDEMKPIFTYYSHKSPDENEQLVIILLKDHSSNEKHKTILIDVYTDESGFRSDLFLKNIFNTSMRKTHAQTLQSVADKYGFSNQYIRRIDINLCRMLRAMLIKQYEKSDR